MASKQLYASFSYVLAKIQTYLRGQFVDVCHKIQICQIFYDLLDHLLFIFVTFIPIAYPLLFFQP
jgi:hypothetical protein